MTIPTEGAYVIGAVDTQKGSGALTFCGKANTNKRDGLVDFDQGICHSGTGDCYNENGVSTPWGKGVYMMRLICDLARGIPLPDGVTVSYN